MLSTPRLSMNELTTFRWSFDEDLHHYVRAGFEAVGVWRRKLTDFGEERGMELLAESCLRVSNLMWAGGFTGNDGRTQAESVDDARAAIRMAAELQAGCLVLFTGGRNNHTQRHADRLIRGALDELLPLADDHQVTIAVKPMHAACASEWSVLTGLEATSDLLADYSSPRLKLAYDTYHFPVCGDNLALLADLAPLVGIVHLADAQAPHGIDQERSLLGHGRLPVREIIVTLLEAGYDGDFDVELMGSAVEATDYESLLTCSRQFFADTVAAVGVARQ